MNDALIPILTKLLQQYGNGLCTDTRRLKAFLSDLASGCKRESNALIQAADCRISQELAQQASSKLDVFAYNNFVQRLMNETSITHDAAEWAVRAWATALNKQLPPNVPLSQQTPKVESAAVSKTTAPTDLGVTAEQKRLLDIMLNPQYLPQERATAGREINKIGDPRPGVGLRPDGLPDIVWCEVPAGEFIYQKDERVTLPAFHIAKYPVTYKQFQAFIDAPDGFSNATWWDGLHEDGLQDQRGGPGEQRFKFWNHPRERVSWYDALAFCRWLTDQLDCTIMLPTEEQWEKAARGTDGREYPFSGEFDPTKGNTAESGIGQTSAVGVFPDGASPYGVMDMSGNVWEWTLTEYETRNYGTVNSNNARVLRGGSWRNTQYLARSTYRLHNDPTERSSSNGFRVALPFRPF